MSSNRATCVFLAAACLLAAGCQSLFGPKGPPPDPLIVLKKPAEGKVVSGPPSVLAYCEPTPPRDPFQKEQEGIATSPPRRIPAILTNRVMDPGLRERDK